MRRSKGAVIVTKSSLKSSERVESSFNHGTFSEIINNCYIVLLTFSGSRGERSSKWFLLIVLD